MRNARDEQNKRRFSREEWLTVVQIKNFFSRLASSKRKGQDAADDQTEIEEILEEEEESNRQEVVNSIVDEIGLLHPIYYDVYDLYQYGKPTNFHSLMFQC